jgi:hypothetical protein
VRHKNVDERGSDLTHTVDAVTIEKEEVFALADQRACMSRLDEDSRHDPTLQEAFLGQSVTTGAARFGHGLKHAKVCNILQNIRTRDLPSNLPQFRAPVSRGSTQGRVSRLFHDDKIWVYNRGKRTVVAENSIWKRSGEAVSERLTFEEVRQLGTGEDARSEEDNCTCVGNEAQLDEVAPLKGREPFVELVPSGVGATVGLGAIDPIRPC